MHKEFAGRQVGAYTVILGPPLSYDFTPVSLEPLILKVKGSILTI